MSTAKYLEVYLTPTDIARKCQVDPSAPVRWMRKGLALRTGDRLTLRFVCTPGGYRVKSEWLDTFLAAIAEDRATTPAPMPKMVETLRQRKQRLARMNADLATAGFSTES
jgi:hypothetical protein